MTADAGIRVLGIEGTAWAASAAVYDSATGTVDVETEAYVPESGGLHPREAAEHMAAHLPSVVETVLDRARDDGVLSGEGDETRPAEEGATNPASIDAVAFSRGPGLGPCLRLAGTSARAVAQRLDVPLVGVNHMVAHLEVGRHFSGFADPVCLNASGANAHVLGYRDGRYRVLGETMDTGVGNAIDKFTRHVGWSHPGGPKVERAAREGEYVDLPYVVKGMDFSFSGIMSAAKQAYDDGTPVEDVCCGLQETIFAMLTEVAERALSLSGSNELVLGGGVGQNDRLREMLASMCDQRGADFFAPEARFLRDNAGMIAILGAKMYAADDTLSVEASGIDADFRPDEVAVTWREGEGENGAEPTDSAASGPTIDDSESGPDVDQRDAATVRGAEATVTIAGDRVHKRRLPRDYRHPVLDERLRRQRTAREAQLTSECRRAGVPTPLVRDVDTAATTLTVQRVGDAELRAALTPNCVRAVARHLARIHEAGFVHGDPTTRNVRVRTDDAGADPSESAGATSEGSSGAADNSKDTPEVFLIDFGLGYHSQDPEDHAMDLHVLEQSLTGTSADAERLRGVLADTYREAGNPAVLDSLRDIQERGRYQ